MSARLVVTGFASHGELDRFVRSEIRYFRSRDMRAYRSEVPGCGPALVFTFGDRPDLGATAQALARRYPALTFAWSPALDSAAQEAATDLPEIEEIYSTF